MAIQIGQQSFSYLRDAINSVLSGQTIELGAGTYDIASSPNYTEWVPTSVQGYTKYYGSSAYVLSRFFSAGSTIENVAINGADTQTTSIINLERIYSGNKDILTLPSAWTLSNLTLQFNRPYSGPGSGDYILQTGNFRSNPSLPYPDAGAVKNLTINQVAFTGTHAGSQGSNGAYCVLVKSDNLLFDGNTVETLTGQQGYVAGSTNTRSSGGSAFLFVQGDSMKILNSSFREGSFSNSVTLFDSTNFDISNNNFDALNQIKQRGEIVKSSNGLINNNHFNNGSRLDLIQVDGKSVAITNNGFDGGMIGWTVVDGEILSGVGISIANTATIDAARSITCTGNTFKDVIPVLSAIPQAATGNSGDATAQLTFGQNNVYNPASGESDLFDRLLVGGTGDDQLTGAFGVTPLPWTERDFLTGGKGNDTLTGSWGNDAFAFTAPPGTVNGNVDLVTDFNGYLKGPADKIWLDNAIYTQLSKGSLGSNFGTYINPLVESPEGFWAGTSLFYDTLGQGRTSESDSVFKIAYFVSNGVVSPAITASDFVVF